MLRVIRRLPSKTPRLVEYHHKTTDSQLYCGSVVRYYSGKQGGGSQSRQSGGGGSGAVYTLGALALVGTATIGYAKYDPEFRKTLITAAPFTDNIIKFVFQEENVLSTLYLDVKKTVTETIIGDGSDKKKKVSPAQLSNVSEKFEQNKEYKAPAPIIPAIEKDVKKTKPEELYAEIRLEQKTAGEPTVDVVGDVKPKKDDKLVLETDPANLADLEEKICEAATEAVNAYNKAIYNLKIYSRQVDAIVDESVDKIQSTTWESIKSKSKEKNDSIRLAQEKADEATNNIIKLKQIVAKPDYKVPDATKEMITLHISKVQEDIDKAKHDFAAEQKISGASERYWDKVDAARKHFADELESLFPNINLKSKHLNVKEDELDLFLLHAYSNVLFYQKELARAEQVLHEKIAQAVDDAKKFGGEFLTTAQICEAVEQEKRKLSLCFQQQCLKIKQDAANEMREQLKRQSQCFTDHLDDAVRTRSLEIERVLARKFDEDLEAERCKYKMQLSAMVGRLRGLDLVLKAKNDADEFAKQAQILWSSCQALLRAIRAGCPGVPWKDQLRPLDAEISAVRKAASPKDELVNAVIVAIPSEARDRGVFPEDALRERFLKVEQVARNMALVPENGAALPVHVLSYIQALFLFKSASPIPQAELVDEQVDFSHLNTNEILQRARYWLDRGDFAQSLKYMNLLKGAPRTVAKQWMNETRILLETQQAANTLMAHAASGGLMYL